jgi:hypothetical protein
MASLEQVLDIFLLHRLLTQMERILIEPCSGPELGVDLQEAGEEDQDVMQGLMRRSR